jgi:D-3-phosphoglycerate dehydrogenase
MADTTKFKILVSDKLSEEGLAILKAEPRFTVDVNTKLTPEELKKVIGDYDAIVIRSGTKLTKDILEHTRAMKVIGRAGVGVDNVDVPAASKKGIIVMNTPLGNTMSTAEQTFSLLLSLSRSIPQAVKSMKEGKWERSKFMGVELYGKKLGIVGLGRIGSEVARRANAFGMKVLAYDPYLTEEKAKEIEVTLVALEALFKDSDYITVHTPLIDETRHLISGEAFSKMKQGVRIINCARGGIVDEAALLEAIKAQKVAGAALDVFEKEPPAGNPLIALDNVIATPHLGASTEEAQVNVAIEVAHQVADALLGRGIRNAVNMPSLEPEEYRMLEPYIRLVEKMGLLLAQILESPCKTINIKYSGQIVAHNLFPLTSAFLKGLLAPILGETVNYINAAVIAKERGVVVEEIKTSEVEDFTNLISVEAVTQQGKKSVAGTLFTNVDPRIVKIGEFNVDVVPQGVMVVIYNIDKPGIVGEIGNIMGENHINIAGMTFGRVTPGGNAITVLNVDSDVPASVLARIKKAKNIVDVKVIKL